MEAVEVLAAAAPPSPGLNKDLSPIAKGKRTKRLRPHSPIPFTITAVPTQNNRHDGNLLRRSPDASSEESTTTEEVDTARCLILLSRGYFSNATPNPPADHSNDPGENNRHGAAAYAAKAGGGACVYTCKTCSRSFPSFQALGGHRASHKKPKNEKRAVAFSDEEDFPSPSSKHGFPLNSLSLQLSSAFSAAALKSSPSPRIHECSYCGAEFTSGQALGGHMRKHRAGPIIRSPDIAEPKKPARNGNGLSLDLNLPAAPEDEKSPKQSDQKAKPGFAHHYYSTID